MLCLFWLCYCVGFYLDVWFPEVGVLRFGFDLQLVMGIWLCIKFGGGVDVRRGLFGAYVFYARRSCRVGYLVGLVCLRDVVA